MLIPDFYTLNMFLHLVAVSLWLGVTVIFSLMVSPLLRNIPEDIAEEQLDLIGAQARRLVTTLMLVLLITGTINLKRVGLLNFSELWLTAYGLTAMLKVGLALTLFAAFPVIIISVHRYGSDELEARLTRMDYLHWILSGITLIILFLGVLMRG